MYIGSRRLKHTINLSIPAMGVQVLVNKDLSVITQTSKGGRK